jgi:hypothetical protein
MSRYELYVTRQRGLVTWDLPENVGGVVAAGLSVLAAESLLNCWDDMGYSVPRVQSAPPFFIESYPQV